MHPILQREIVSQGKPVLLSIPDGQVEEYSQQERLIGLLELLIEDGAFAFLHELVGSVRGQREILEQLHIKQVCSVAVQILRGCLEVGVQHSEGPDLLIEVGTASEDIQHLSVVVAVLQHPQNLVDVEYLAVEDIFFSEESDDVLFSA